MDRVSFSHHRKYFISNFVFLFCGGSAFVEFGTAGDGKDDDEFK